MTKRRAENILPPEIPIKRSFRSLSNVDKPVVCVNVIQNAKPFVGQQCRKRPKCLEDPLDTDNQPRKVSANRVVSDKNTCKSRTFEDATGRPVTRRSSCALQMESNKKPDEENNLTAGDKVNFYTTQVQAPESKVIMILCVASRWTLCNDGRWTYGGATWSLFFSTLRYF